VICVHHNVESVLLARRAEAERHPLRRAYLRHQAALTERTERDWSGRVALNICVSEPDAAVLRGIAPRAKTFVVPNGVDVELFQPAAPGSEGLVFVGGTTWFPNLDALQFFCQDILPAIRTRHPGVPVTWVGRASASERELFRHQYGVELTGYVTDIRPFVQRAACYVVPLRVGGGTRLKILDAWALGMPLVSTTVGAEGLDARDGENILLRDDAAGFAEAVCRLLENEGLRRRLSERARATAVETYSWEVIGRDMIPAYQTVLEGARA